MSYNISNWTTRRLENLIIPMNALCRLSDSLKRRGWSPIVPKFAGIEGSATRRRRFRDVFVEIDIAEATRVSGKLMSVGVTSIAVSKIHACGEASGTAYQEILMPALRQSKGILEAVLMWEGGDSITRLVVEDGEITEKEIEL